MVAISAISAGLGIVSSIFGGASQAKAANQAKRDAAKLTEWENKTSELNWKYNNDVRDFQYNQDLRIYNKSKDVYGQQLGFNQSAASRSYASEQAKMSEYLQGLAFNKQDMFVELLKAQGSMDASGRASGRSSSRLSTGMLSQFGRNNAVLAENLTSYRKQYGIDMSNIALQKRGADLDAFTRLGLAPEKGPTAPKPLTKPTAGGSVNPALTIASGIASSIGGSLSSNGSKGLSVIW
jgi:hypothetical protein